MFIQGHRSWCQSTRICDILLVINSNFGLSPTVFEILTSKAGKWLNFPTPPLFDAPIVGSP